MKILEIIYSLSSGGAERFVVDLSNCLAANTDNDVTILTICDMEKNEHAHYLPDVNRNVRVVNLHMSKGLCIQSLIGVYRVIRDERPDIVHCHSNLILLYLPALVCGNVRFIHTLHSLAHVCLGWNCLKSFNKWLYSSRVQPVTISIECSKSYSALYGTNNDVVITNGRTRIQTTSRLPEIKSDMSSLLVPHAPVFINVARCHPAKNHEMLFKVFDRLTSEGNNCQLLVLGSGHEGNMMKYSNHPNIHIIGECRNVADYIACADYFVLSSSYEGLPLTLLEAMSMGCVPVCTPAGGIADVIRDGENGYLAAGFDADNMYDAVKRAIAGDGSISRDAIIADYNSHYSMELCADRYYILYRTRK